MHAMQYEITLPADYDMGIIRDRVARRGHLLDGFPGLGLKAYLMRERAAGSPVNQYAPLYLWAAPEGMNGFLWGPGFQGIVDDFGRPEVQHWTGAAYHDGPSAAAGARTAVRRRQRLPPGVRPGPLVEEAAAETERLARREGAVCAALGVDPYRWELMHVTLWDHDSPAAPGDRYEVLHVSSPERGSLGRGRHW
ncbi:hypothetical protein QFZ82_006862 [Streptomyces sp. V4I23]|uniref:DUF4865 family protein n=1 Tax=Streptomyces sp. V4I23 TaxID=3042282 RepID=UPI00278932F5|nr:DUF4865 family protein [Streptomyces sp. V4I23]MDQ1012377.1 hypothetical protein [Streptomyces sp. V4I23]